MNRSVLYLIFITQDNENLWFFEVQDLKHYRIAADICLSYLNSHLAEWPGKALMFWQKYFFYLPLKFGKHIENERIFMMRTLRRIITLHLLLLVWTMATGQTKSWSISENGRYLKDQDGKPFFYLGDTAWELFHRLSLEEADRYLIDRSAKGFTVIQAVVLAQLGGLSVPNANGDLPLIEKDPGRPSEAYFEHVDAIVKRANELGLVIGMLPSWGSYWSAVNSNETIFDIENAEEYGRFLGERYGDQQVIWILGGDENINNRGEEAIINAMAKGLGQGHKGRQLVTFHPRGPGRSSDYFHKSTWLDFNMSQSSHAGHDHDNGLFTEHDHRLHPAKPTLDGEPRYELIPVGFYFSGSNRLDLFDDYDVRQAAYWSILAGACGHTYGHNSIWQMWAPKHRAVIGAKVPWEQALDHSGAFQMGILHKLFRARPFHLLKPEQGLDSGGS